MLGWYTVRFADMICKWEASIAGGQFLASQILLVSIGNEAATVVSISLTIRCPTLKEWGPWLIVRPWKHHFAWRHSTHRTHTIFIIYQRDKFWICIALGVNLYIKSETVPPWKCNISWADICFSQGVNLLVFEGKKWNVFLFWTITFSEILTRNPSNSKKCILLHFF